MNGLKASQAQLNSSISRSNSFLPEIHRSYGGPAAQRQSLKISIYLLFDFRRGSEHLRERFCV